MIRTVIALAFYASVVASQGSRGGASTTSDCLKGIEDGTLTLSPKLISDAMRVGDWKCARELAEYAQGNGVDCRNVFDLESRTIMKEIQGLKAVLDKTLPVNVVNPAFQWAQSPTDLFLNIKFAHKLDAPATLNVEAQNVSVQSRQLTLHASDGRKKFVLEMNFLRDVIPENCTWAMASVGRMTFTLPKANAPSKWPRLLLSKNKLPNMHLWWEIHEQHLDALELLKDEPSAEGGSSSAGDDDGDDAAPVKTPKNNTASNAANATAAADEKAASTPEIAALVAQRDAVAKELKARVASIDEDVRRRKKEQDMQLREAKASIDREFDQLRAEAQKKADAQKAELESKINELKAQLQGANGDAAVKAEL